ncbi:hypothetical protein EDB81DRAFT_944584 [Dactylonectria macrodidyma]|uniref:Nephrocystin 3-like N-terminal domain-containing protein n=1 Tax=Dactylonectria macrodidyma TaxID=307937 RepID=A0A9P9JDI5_9HYPO|nr:hypothetical protein EDB81DRAFT_944584 [Dactylonectria macrodidyma]
MSPSFSAHCWRLPIYSRSLASPLGKPNLSKDIVSIIRITMKGSDANVKKLEEQLERVKREGTPEKLRSKFTNFNRRMVQFFQHGEVKRVQVVLDELCEDLNMAVNLLSLNTTATTLDDLRKVHEQPAVLKNSIQDSSKDRLEKEEVGCGKTVLCSSVIEELRNRASRRTDRIAHSYFTFNDTSCHGITGFLKSILWQLCLKDSIHPVMEVLHHICGLDPPSAKELQATFLTYLASSCALKNDAQSEDPHVFIVLDGLDEIPYGPDRAMVLRLLSHLAKEDYPKLHMLVSSRPERDIEREILGNRHWYTFYTTRWARHLQGVAS